MPSRYLCDYCDVFLTHDSASVRRAHNAGRNHLSNVRDYYASLGNDRIQELIDNICAAYEHGGGGQARILQMGPGGLPMGAPVGAVAMGQMGGGGGGPPPMGGMGAPPMRFAGPPIPGLTGSPAGPPAFPPTPVNGAAGPGAIRFGAGPMPPQPNFGAPPNGAPMPPPGAFFPGRSWGGGKCAAISDLTSHGRYSGFRPPPGMPFPPPSVAPQPSASSPPPPAAAGAGATPGGPPPAAGGGGAKLINGLNPERAKMLGLI
ncbi:hypothetical protein JCM10212_000138 [Sporobolomyces blumeae]